MCGDCCPDLVNGAGDDGDGDGGWQGSHDSFSSEPPQESSGDSYWSALVLDHSPAMPGCGSCGSYGKKGSCLYIPEPRSSLEATKTSWDTSKLAFAASFTNQGHLIRKRCQTLSLLSSRLLLDMFCPLEGSNTFCTLLFQREKRLMVS